MGMAPSSSVIPTTELRPEPEAPAPSPSPAIRKRTKYRSLRKIMRTARRAVVVDSDDDDNFYGRVACEACGGGDRADELLLCDRCDRGYHMVCVRPIVARIPNGPWHCTTCVAGDRNPPLKCFTQQKIVEFFRIQKGEESDGKSTGSPQDSKKRRRRTRPLVMHKRSRRLLPYVPSEDPTRRLMQLGTVAAALKAHGMEFSNELTYEPGMAQRSDNRAELEDGGMQVLCKEDIETLELIKAMHTRGEDPPLIVTFDNVEGYTVEADGPIKDLTLLAEYVGDVDYLKNREQDDCDSLMTLLLAKDPSKSLVICPEKRGNVARFLSGINNHTPGSRKKQNVKCVRYDVNGECRVLLVATRDIAKGERLYYDYNGYEHEYPTHNFV